MPRRPTSPGFKRKSYVLARSTAKLFSIGLSWSRVKAKAFALSLVDAASASFSWVKRKSYALARSTAKLLSIGLSWSRVKARPFRAFTCRCRVGQLLLGQTQGLRLGTLDRQTVFGWPCGAGRRLTLWRFPLSMPRRSASPGSNARSTSWHARPQIGFNRPVLELGEGSRFGAFPCRCRVGQLLLGEGKAHALARSTAKLLSIGLSWSRVKAQALALLLLNLALVSQSWIVAKAHDLASSLPKLVSAMRLQARRYRRRGLALAGTLPERARVGIQDLHRSTEPLRLALKRLHIGSSTSNGGPSADEEVSGLIPKRNDHIEPEPHHAPFQHQEPVQEHGAFLVPIEKEIIAVKSLTGTSSSTGPIDARGKRQTLWPRW